MQIKENIIKTRTLTLELTEQEAAVLSVICGNIIGPQHGTKYFYARRILDNIYEGLREEYNCFDEDFFANLEDYCTTIKSVPN